MMNSLKKLYRDFFGLNEAAGKIETDDPKQAEEMAKKGMDVKLIKPGMTTEDLEPTAPEDIDEAQLVNHITDYKGGIEYVVRDPATAELVSQEISEWAQKKGFTIIKKTISPTKKVGYFYFRLGNDPALESQKLQGYLSQKPELKHFRFNVRNSKPQRKI